MKFLFAVDSVDFPAAVNPQLAARLAGQLVEMGHSVSLLRLWDGQTPLPFPPAGVQIHDIAFTDEHQMNLDLENGRKNGSPFVVRVARLLTHPAAASAAFRQLILHKNKRQIVCRHAMEELDHQYHYDVVVAVCAPYHTAWALADASLTAKKATWQMDPYSTNREYVPYGGVKKELAMYHRIDRAFITRLMVPDYQNGVFASVRDKIRILEFPCLSPLPYIATDEHKGLRCVFAGSLHPVIRRPEVLLSLFLQISDIPDIQLVMLGGGWDNFSPDITNECRKAMGERLYISGPVSSEKARKNVASADVLINIGNTVINQLPSKIFEYFSTGKPVLNLCTNRQDPALKYFARYPLALTLYTDEAGNAERLRRWLSDISEKHLDFDYCSSLFYENTPASVAESMLSGLR